jgi:hypothetical protein
LVSIYPFGSTIGRESTHLVQLLGEMKDFFSPNDSLNVNENVIYKYLICGYYAFCFNVSYIVLIHFYTLQLITLGKFARYVNVGFIDSF